MSIYEPFNEHKRPIDLFKISKKIWRPKEIAERIPDVSVRQIADLAEKGIIQSVVKASGPGTSRLYNVEGLYSIVVGLTARPVLNHEDLKVLIQILLKEESKTEKPMLCLVQCIEHGHFNVDTFTKDNVGNWDHELFNRPWGGNIIDQARLIINLHSVKWMLKANFN